MNEIECLNLSRLPLARTGTLRTRGITSIYPGDQNIVENDMKYLALIFIGLFLVGCATTQSDMEGAEAFCENNGGVSKIKAKYNSTVRVTCNDSARFTFKGIK